MTNTTNC